MLCFCHACFWDCRLRSSFQCCLWEAMGWSSACVRGRALWASDTDGEWFALLDRTTEILPEELMLLQRALYSGSNRHWWAWELKKESWTCKGIFNPAKGSGWWCPLRFSEWAVAWKAAFCSERTLVEQDDKKLWCVGPKAGWARCG